MSIREEENGKELLRLVVGVSLIVGIIDYDNNNNNNNNDGRSEGIWLLLVGVRVGIYDSLLGVFEEDRIVGRNDAYNSLFGDDDWKIGTLDGTTILGTIEDTIDDGELV